MEEYEYVLTVRVRVSAPDEDFARVFVEDYFGPGATDGTLEIESLKIKTV